MGTRLHSMKANAKIFFVMGKRFHIHKSRWKILLFVCDYGSVFKKNRCIQTTDKINTQLAIDTVNCAVARRGKSSGIIFQTDRGTQYTSKEFRKHLNNWNMIQSFFSKRTSLWQCNYGILFQISEKRRSRPPVLFIDRKTENQHF